jgi:hypothetical protein
MKKIDKTYSDILVIGNGFDLNQKLPTSYSDFIKSKHFNDLKGKNNFFVDYLSNRFNIQKWIDVENELKLYSKNQSKEEAINSFKKEYKIVCIALKEYLSNLDYASINENEYSYKVIQKIMTKDFLILDFNYTETTKLILEQLGVDSVNIEERLIKLHGDIKTEIIFGIEDNVDIKKNHVFLRKAYSKYFTSINLKVPLETCNNLYFFGHSLGETDHMYFKPFFEKYSLAQNYGKGKKIELYHFGEEGYNQLFMQIDTMTNKHLSIFRQNNEIEFIDTSKQTR